MTQDSEAAAPTDDLPGRNDHPDRLVVAARQIRVKGPWGPTYGPIDLEIKEGGLTVLIGPSGRARNALLLTLAGRMRPSSGHISILGFDDDARSAFKHSTVAALDVADEIEQSVRVRDLITEQRRWDAPWYKLIKQATHEHLEQMCGPVYGDLPLPPLHEFVERLTDLDNVLLRIAVANTRRKPLLVVGGLDEMTSDEERALAYERLAELGRTQTVVTADENAYPGMPGVREVVPVHHLHTADVEALAKAEHAKGRRH